MDTPDLVVGFAVPRSASCEVVRWYEKITDKIALAKWSGLVVKYSSDDDAWVLEGQFRRGGNVEYRFISDSRAVVKYPSGDIYVYSQEEYANKFIDITTDEGTMK